MKVLAVGSSFTVATKESRKESKHEPDRSVSVERLILLLRLVKAVRSAAHFSCDSLTRAELQGCRNLCYRTLSDHAIGATPRSSKNAPWVSCGVPVEEGPVGESGLGPQSASRAAIRGQAIKVAHMQGAAWGGEIGRAHV